MDVFDQDSARRRIFATECPRFWESVRVLLKEIARKAESQACHVIIDDSVGNCVTIQVQQGLCPDLFHNKIRTLVVRFNPEALTITAEVTNSCPGVSEHRPDRFMFDADLETGKAFALLRETKFAPNELANQILAQFFRLRPLAPLTESP